MSASRSSSIRLILPGATKAAAAISALSTTKPAQYQYFLSDAKADMNDRREVPLSLDCAQGCVKNGVS